MVVYNICKALSHNTRRNMIEELSKSKNGINFNKLCLIFNANTNNIAFHVKQLIKAKLVSKTGKYYITEMGKSALNITKDLENNILEKLIKNEL